jgi:hypothetical protein
MKKNEIDLTNEFPFESNYITLNGHRLHYIDTGIGVQRQLGLQVNDNYDCR